MLPLLCAILTLAALLQTGAAAVPPAGASCGDSRITPCLLAPISFVVNNPQGLAIIHKMGNRAADALPSQEELNMVCQLQSTAVNCIGDFINQCTASIPNAANFHEFISGSVAVLRSLCARPNLHNDVQLVTECINQSDVKFANNSCVDKIAGSFEDPFSCFNSSSFSFESRDLDFSGLRTFFHDNDVLGSLCCTMDKVRQCAKQDFTGTCSPQADAVIKELFQLLDTSYACSGRLAGCSTISQRTRTGNNGCRLQS